MEPNHTEIARLTLHNIVTTECQILVQGPISHVMAAIHRSFCSFSLGMKKLFSGIPLPISTPKHTAPYHILAVKNGCLKLRIVYPKIMSYTLLIELAT